MSFKNIFKNKRDLFKSPSNITGLSKLPSYSNLKINPIRKVQSLDKFITYDLHQKIAIIREMLNKPYKKQPFDGFAIQSNKYTIESLLHKSCEKEKITIFEKNKLCKNNYPLIKFLSNRKTKNNTKKLLIEILNTEKGELTKE